MITGSRMPIHAFAANWLPDVVHDCTLGAKIAKLCHCSLDRIHIVAT